MSEEEKVDQMADYLSMLKRQLSLGLISETEGKVGVLRQLIDRHAQKTDQQPDKIMNELIHGLDSEDDMRGLAKSFIQA